MRSRIRFLPLVGAILSVALALWGCQDISVLAAIKTAQANALIPKAQWAQTLTAGATGYLEFTSVAVDSSGNIYAAGECPGAVTYGFGNGVTALGSSPSSNVLLLKYSSSGVAQWAQTLTSGTSYAAFDGVAVDSSGNVYAAGYAYGGLIQFNNGITANGASTGANVLLVKYNSSGVAQWAQTITAIVGTGSSFFRAVAVDLYGNIYAVGEFTNTSQYTFSGGQSVTGVSTGDNVVLVKYDSSGLALKAETLTSASSAVGARFVGVTVDASGNVYAAGNMNGTGAYGFGNLVSASGTCSNTNVLLVKYNSSSGNAQWARTLTAGAGANGAQFNGVAADSSGNIYAAGNSMDATTYGFGNGVTATGNSPNNNVLLVKYNSFGAAQWAQTTTAGNGSFNGVAVDSSGNTYATGSCSRTSGFGNGVTAQGASGSNVVLVKYNSSGAAQWAQTTTLGSDNSSFTDVALDSSGNMCASGTTWGYGTFGFGNGVTATGTSAGWNVLLVKY